MELKILLKKVDWNQMKKLNKQNKILKKYYIKNSLLKKELIKNKKRKNLDKRKSSYIHFKYFNTRMAQQHIYSNCYMN